MANKHDKIKKPKTKSKTNLPPIFGSHAAWIIGLLFIALVTVTTLGVIGINNLQSEVRTDFDNARLEVFDDIAKEFIRNTYVRQDKTVQEMTGYGVSDEDGVFYITFNYYTYNDDGTVSHTVHPAIIYFWEDAERGTFSHAFSYPDDPSYHPEGVYVEKKGELNQVLQQD